MKETCKYVGAYKGIHKPRCYGGDGCKACWNKYYDTHKYPEDSSYRRSK